MFDLADAFVKMGGKYLFIDEIYKNKDWSKELNLIYDYHSKLDIVFTGSSVLDIFEEEFRIKVLGTCRSAGDDGGCRRVQP